MLNIDFFLAISFTAIAINILWSGKIGIGSLFILGICIPLFVYMLFGMLLNIRFPDGLIVHYIYG